MVSVPSCSSLVSLLAIVFVVHLALSDPQTQEWIEKICRQMEEFGFCNQTFNENMKSPSMDIVGLTQLTIELTTENATNTHEYTQFLLFNETNPEVIKVLTECVNDYQFVVEAFWKASNDFFGGNYEEMIADESTAPKRISICQSGLSFKPFPVNPFYYLIERNRELRILIAMSIVTGHYIIT